MAITWDATFDDKPSGKVGANLIDDYIRQTREAVGDRINREHELMNTSAPTLDGTHKRGSSRIYVGDSTPSPPVMQDEDVGDGSREIGRQWFDTSKGIQYTYDGTSWMPSGFFYGQIVLATENTYLPSGFVACGATAAIYSDGTKTVHVPALDDAFLKIGAGYVAGTGWTEKTTAPGFTHTITAAELPAHSHDMDHVHNFHGNGSDGSGANTGIRYSQDGSGTAGEDTGTGRKWMSSPIDQGSEDTDMLVTGTIGEGTELDITVSEPPHVELLAYCFIGGLSVV